MDQDIRPNKNERQFLNLAYPRFNNLFDEVMADEFWEKDDWYRFSKVKEGFAVYAELLNYEPIKWTIEQIKKQRPPMEGEIGSELFKFVRNTVTHFPFYNSWDEVWVSKPIINWLKEGQTVDKFLNKYAGKECVKYRFWEEDKKRMTYLTIKFPVDYNEDTKVYLKDFLTEREGVKFSFILMREVLDTQVE